MNHILITNDDGIFAQGLKELIQEFSNDFKITVIVPQNDSSGSSHALSLTRPLRYRKINENIFVVDGTPADCIRFGILFLFKNKKPNIVIAGINSGPNIGNDIWYSGTIGAAIEAMMFKVPSIAVSLCKTNKFHNNYKTAAKVAKLISKYIIRDKLECILNINVPDVKFSKLKGVKITKLEGSLSTPSIIKRFDTFGLPYIWFKRVAKKGKLDAETDLHAIRNGYVSITPITTDLTDYVLINKLKTIPIKI